MIDFSRVKNYYIRCGYRVCVGHGQPVHRLGAAHALKVVHLGADNDLRQRFLRRLPHARRCLHRPRPVLQKAVHGHLICVKVRCRDDQIHTLFLLCP